MAIVFMDGAERNTANGFDFTGSLYIYTDILITGSYCYRTTNGFQATLPGIYTTLYYSFKYRPRDVTGRNDCIYFKDSAGTQTLTVTQNTTSKKWELRLGAYNGTLLETGTVVNSNATIYLIEVQYTPLNSGGEFTLKVDGVEDITYSGDTTNGLENIKYWGCYSDNYLEYDDVIISDSGWLGNVYIQAITATGAGDTTSWDPSTGSNYDCVNEVTASDTDYVSTNVTNEVDTYTMSNLTGLIENVLAVNVFVRSAYEGSPTPTKQQLVLRPASTDRVGSTQYSPALSFQIWNEIFNLNPEDSAAWEEADVNALKLGIKAVA